MTNNISRRSVVAGALAVPFALTAGAVPAFAQAQGDTLIAVIQPEPTVLTATFNNTYANGVVSVNVFDGLASYDENLQPVPSLAERWETSEDGLSITFHLRKGVKWHDDKDFTSEDVKFSLLEVWKKLHARGRLTFQHVKDVETPDAHTAVLRLSQPSPVIFAALNAFEAQVLPKHLYEGTDVTKNPYNLKPVGTGPFRFKEWKKGESVELERNPEYWDKGKPHFQRLIFRIIPDAASRAAAFETGEVQYSPYNAVSLADVARLRENKSLAFNLRGYEWQAQYNFLEFNLRNEYLKNPKVRHAIAHAIDKQRLIDLVWFGVGQPATGPIPSTLTNFYTKDVPSYPFDLKRAAALLDEAGYPKGANGVRFTLNIDYVPFSDTYQQSAEFIRQSLKQVGIEVSMRNSDLPSYIKRIYGAYDFDLNTGLFSAYMDPQLGLIRQFWSKAIAAGTPWTNASGYASPEMDRVIEQAGLEADSKKRVELFHRLQRLAQTDLPILTLFEVNNFTIYSSKLTGISNAPDGALSSLKNVRPK